MTFKVSGNISYFVVDCCFKAIFYIILAMFLYNLYIISYNLTLFFVTFKLKNESKLKQATLTFMAGHMATKT